MAGATLSFIVSQMGHDDARMVYEIYSRLIGDVNQDQVGMLNKKMPTALPHERAKRQGVSQKVI